MFAPTTSRTSSSSSQHIKEVVCFGHDRDMVTAFVNIDMGAVGNWAERRGHFVCRLHRPGRQARGAGVDPRCVEQVNDDLVPDGMVAISQIHRFLVLHKGWIPDDDD